MKITLNGEKYKAPDNSTHVTADKYGFGDYHSSTPLPHSDDGVWLSNSSTTNPEMQPLMRVMSPPADFTKCIALIHDGCVVDFEGM